jgi:putative heme iron utilization protein
MNDERAQALRQLLRAREVAALGTLHGGDPFVSMVPYALLPADGRFVIHVSALATHTRDMLAHDAVSLLVLDERLPGTMAQALPRVTVQGTACQCGRDDPDYATARQAYLARFPDSEDMFGFADFSLFVIAPRAVRFVGGFAQAWSITAADYRAALGARAAD